MACFVDGGVWSPQWEMRTEEPLKVAVDVPKDGVCFLLLRVRSDAPLSRHDSVMFGIDNGPTDRCQLRSPEFWTWSLAAHNA